MENQDKVLNVYNASAGSGKTFQLVLEYIHLLIKDEHQPERFSEVVAMTFTNKASVEMKERILEGLYDLASNDSKANSLRSKLEDRLKIGHDEIDKRSKRALKLILHSYEDFNVMTIDKFNLRLIKSFSRDLNLSGDFEVELDEDSLIEQVVDELLHTLGREGHGELNKIIFEYSNQNLDDEKTWNVRRNLVQFAKILKSERNAPLIARLLDIDFSIENYRDLQGQRQSIHREYTKLCSSLQPLLISIDQNTIHRKGSTIKKLNDLANATKFDGKYPINSYVKEAMDQNRDNALSIEMCSIVNTILSFYESHLNDFERLRLVLRNFFDMAILQHLAVSLQEFKTKENIIRISEFNELIGSLIQTENAPFIYERLGNRFSHFLLDEFQDTSRLQWLNLVPLIENSISERKANLIVGDPKQSIYRFKNGVAEQFVALPGIYNPEGKPEIERISKYFQQMGRIHPLESNWRSSPVIVNFNNELFTKLKSKLPDRSRSFYETVEQEPQSNISGRVIIDSREGKSTEEEEIAQIDSWIKECIKDGFQPGDICILGRRNYSCNSWALGLTELGHKVVSSDSLLIDSNIHVQLALSYLRRRLKPSGATEMKQFAELYFRILGKPHAHYSKYFKTGINSEKKEYTYFDDTEFLIEQFSSKEAFFFHYENLYELLQGFMSLLGYDELKQSYLHHLADMAYEFGLSKGPDLKSFLEYYDGAKSSIALQVPESSDAIQIMTIHKSKGLEFPIVIIPSLAMKNQVFGEMLIDTGSEIVYTKPKKEEILDSLQEAHDTEMEQLFTDQLNLCYVGMTRPKNRLYVRNVFEPKHFGAVIHEALRELEDGKELEDGIHLNRSHNSDEKGSRAEQAQFYTPRNAKDRLWFPDIALQDKKDLYDGEYLSEEMQFGIQFHLLISRIDTEDQIEREVERALNSGEVSRENVSELKKKLQSLLRSEEYCAITQGAKQVLNEITIVASEKELVRPDKLIIKEEETILVDFKTGRPQNKDRKQLKDYRIVLESMGYPQVECYLSYISTGKFEQVL